MGINNGILIFRFGGEITFHTTFHFKTNTVRRAHNGRGKYITIMCVPFMSLARGDLSQKVGGPSGSPHTYIRMKIQWTADAAATAARIISAAAVDVLYDDQNT